MMCGGTAGAQPADEETQQVIDEVRHGVCARLNDLGLGPPSRPVKECKLHFLLNIGSFWLVMAYEGDLRL